MRRAGYSSRTGGSLKRSDQDVSGSIHRAPVGCLESDGSPAAIAELAWRVRLRQPARALALSRRLTADEAMLPVVETIRAGVRLARAEAAPALSPGVDEGHGTVWLARSMMVRMDLAMGADRHWLPSDDADRLQGLLSELERLSHPGDVGMARHLIARVLFRRGAFRAAETGFEAAAQRFAVGDSPARVAMALTNIAICRSMLGDSVGAVRGFLRALQHGFGDGPGVRPRLDGLVANLAVSCWRLGDTARAYVYARHVIDRGGLFEQHANDGMLVSLISLVSSLDVMTGRTERAERLVERAALHAQGAATPAVGQGVQIAGALCAVLSKDVGLAEQRCEGLDALPAKLERGLALVRTLIAAERGDHAEVVRCSEGWVESGLTSADPLSCMGVAAVVRALRAIGREPEAEALETRLAIEASARADRVRSFRAERAHVGLYGLISETQGKQARERQSRLRSEAEHLRRVSTVGEIAAAVVHDVNNTLQAALGEVWASMDAEGVPPGVVASLTRAEEAILAAASLNHQVLGLARPGPDSTTQTELCGWLSTHQRLWRSAAGRGVRFEIQPPVAPVHVLGGSTELVQVVLNAVHNASQAVGGKGRIRIGVEVTSAHADLVISDDGPGIPPEDHERVFEAFYTTRREGHGLGLATVRSTLRSRGGDAFVRPTAEPGATLVLRLARTPAPSVAGSRS